MACYSTLPQAHGDVCKFSRKVIILRTLFAELVLLSFIVNKTAGINIFF